MQLVQDTGASAAVEHTGSLRANESGWMPNTKEGLCRPHSYMCVVAARSSAPANNPAWNSPAAGWSRYSHRLGH